MTLAILALAFAAPAAHAAVADDLPVYGAADGVHVVRQPGKSIGLRFDVKAAKLYRSLAGHKVTKACVGLTPQGAELVVDSTLRGRSAVPRRRGTVYMGAGGGVDICSLGMPERANGDDGCRPLFAGEQVCARVIVALSDHGRAYLDALSRSLELFYGDEGANSNPPDFGMSNLEWLQGTVGDVVALDGPDASPPIGRIGYWEQGSSHVLAVLRADGVRRFLRRDGDVVATNDPRLIGRALAVF
ncbi:MAG TPA: hypothetical protein VI300_11385 [Solirubrobacter sp.]